MESKIFTYQAFIKYEGAFSFLSDSLCIFSRLERKLFAAYQVNKDKKLSKGIYHKLKNV